MADRMTSNEFISLYTSNGMPLGQKLTIHGAVSGGGDTTYS